MGWRTAAGCKAVGLGCVAPHHSRLPLEGGSMGLFATEHHRCATLSRSLQGWISALQVRSDQQAQATVLCRPSCSHGYKCETTVCLIDDSQTSDSLCALDLLYDTLLVPPL